jgi:hypothetical protein
VDRFRAGRASAVDSVESVLKRCWCWYLTNRQNCMELHEELAAVCAIFGDEVVVIDNCSCRVSLKRLIVEVAWSSPNQLPCVKVNDNSFARHVEAVLGAAAPGDAVVFDLIERLREAERDAEAEESAAAAAEAVDVKSEVHAKRDKQRTQEKKSGAKKNNNNTNNKTNNPGGGGSSSKPKDGKPKPNNDKSSSTYNKPQPRKQTESVFVPHAILSADQENRLATLLRLDEADVPSANVGGSIGLLLFFGGN